MNLTSYQLHCFKRELIHTELCNEIRQLQQTANLTAVRVPADPQELSEYPLLNYLFQHVVQPFPLLQVGSDDDFWVKCETFLCEMCESWRETCIPKRVDEQQKSVFNKLEKTMVLLLSAHIRTKLGHEATIEPRPSVLDEDPQVLSGAVIPGTRVNVVAVRKIVVGHGPFRTKESCEFIIESLDESNASLYHVARRHGDFRRLGDQLKSAFPGYHVPAVPQKAKQEKGSGHPYRERDRILLRSFLRRIARDTTLGTSEIFTEFTTRDAIQMSPEEQEDATYRLKLDQERLEQEELIKQEINARVIELQDLLQVLKKQVLRPGGLVQIFATIRTTERVEDLPFDLKKAFEWGRVSFAFHLHQQFVTSESAPEHFATLKRTHGMMPYRALSAILRISNPVAMVRHVIDLFLAQPFGHKSLIQRMIGYSMNEEIKTMQKKIAVLKEKIDDPDLCCKIENAVLTDKTPLLAEKLDVPSFLHTTLSILEYDDIKPQLSSARLEFLRSYNTNPASFKTIKHLHRLWTLTARLREQEMLMDVVFQGVTGELLKDLFSIVYRPLAQIYKAAGIGKSMRHVAQFLDELIELLESYAGKACPIQPLIDLVQRHEQNFYSFVHQVHSQDRDLVFSQLLEYMDKIFAFVARDRTPVRIDLDACVEHADLTKDERDLLQKEIEALCEYRLSLKLRRLERTRQKMYQQHVNDDVDALKEFIPQDADMAQAWEDLQEMESSEDEQNSDSDVNEDSESSSTSSTLPSFPVPHTQLQREPPKLVLIPKILPVFMHEIQAILPRNAIDSQ